MVKKYMQEKGADKDLNHNSTWSKLKQRERKIKRNSLKDFLLSINFRA